MSPGHTSASCSRSRLREARGGERRRAAGAGRKPKLVFCDRLLLTLVHLRHQLPHEVLAELYDVDRSTVSTAIRQVCPLLAARGFAVPHRPGMRLRTLEDLFAYAEAEGIEPRLDGAETQVRRPQAGRPGRRAFVSGKRRQNTVKTTTFSDGQGRILLSGVVRPGRMHDQTAVRTEGIAEQLRLHPSVKCQADAGYAGLAKEFPDQVTAPQKKPKDDACDGDMRAAGTVSAVRTDCESIRPALGSTSRSSASRTLPRRASWMRSTVPSSCHQVKYQYTVGHGAKFLR